LLEKYNSPDVAYGCETWSPSLTDEPRLTEFERSVLRKIFVSETERGIAGWNNLLHKDLHTCYAPSNILVIKSRKMRRPLGSPRRRGKKSIKIHLKETGAESLTLISLPQDRHKWLAVVITGMKLRVP
jgi:hypothetical protein